MASGIVDTSGALTQAKGRMPRLPRVAVVGSIARWIWASPNTVLGALLVLAGCWRVRLDVVDGVVEAHGPALAWLLTNIVPLRGGAAAITLGHVVVARDAYALCATRAHERVHVRQCERWGPLFLPAYVASSLTAALRGRHFYFDNAFEVEACRETDR